MFQNSNAHPNWAIPDTDIDVITLTASTSDATQTLKTGSYYLVTNEDDANIAYAGFADVTTDANKHYVIPPLTTVRVYTANNTSLHYTASEADTTVRIREIDEDI